MSPRAVFVVVVVVVAGGLVACGGARSKSAEAPAAAAPKSPAGAPAAEAAPPPDAFAPSTARSSQPTATGTSAPPSSRSIAMAQATSDVEASQRELDVAGGDCQNACRALGSMDRAAGRLCNLAQSDDEQRRCGEVKNRLYSARDKVRSTCGTCPDVSVERSAPIPSR